MTLLAIVHFDGKGARLLSIGNDFILIWWLLKKPFFLGWLAHLRGYLPYTVSERQREHVQPDETPSSLRDKRKETLTATNGRSIARYGIDFR